MQSQIIENNRLTADLWEMLIYLPEFANKVKSGQFVMVIKQGGKAYLRRPLAIAGVENNCVRIFYRVLGLGTAEFSELMPGDAIDVDGPLGKGFTINEKKTLLVGGGVGIAPLIQAAD